MNHLNTERSTVASLAAIMAFRMLGLFMILPVFAVQANRFHYSTPVLVGLALGIYGFTQACLQIPFGMLSDRIGRKPIIATGLILFAIGSIIAALSTDIYWLILGRACQGAGAIGSTTLALLADLTRDEHRSKAMATIGLAIGCSFSLAMVLGPIVNAWFNLEGIFWCTAGLAVLGLILLYTTVPTPPKIIVHRNVETEPGKIKAILKNPQLLRLDGGIFCLHASLTALFLVIPILLLHTLQLSEFKQVIFYLAILATSFALMIPFIIIAEKKQKMRSIFIGAIGALLLSQLLLLWQQHHVATVGLILLLFFTAFTLLEATLPSWISKVTPIRSKGTAMGVYSSAQFLGIFVGGTLGGWIYSHYAINGVLCFTSLLLLIWLVSSVGLKHPPYLSTLILQLKQFIQQDPTDLSEQLSQIPAIAEVAIMTNEDLVYLKINQKIMSKHELPKHLERSNLVKVENK